MAAYIYYTSNTPSNVAEWETKPDWIGTSLDSVAAVDVIKALSGPGEIQIASIEEGANPKKFIVYFELRATLDAYLSNNPVNVITICEDSAVVQYCADNNITYSISVSDTTSSLTEVISSIDNENFDNWFIAHST